MTPPFFYSLMVYRTFINNNKIENMGLLSSSTTTTIRNHILLLNVYLCIINNNVLIV